MPERRTLDFARLDELMPEVDRLLRGGYRPVGNWSLAQIGSHLTQAIRYSMEGYPIRAPWPIRVTVGRIARRRLLASGRMPEGIWLPEKALPAAGLDDRAEAEALRAAVGILRRRVEPMAGHPLFGAMAPDDWRRFHAIHAAHHLSFLIPVR